MRINERTVASNSASAIFGSVGELPQAINSRASLRIGLWSCLSDGEPEIAMGLWLTLAHLLERWRDIEVYRLFVKFEDEPEDFVWTMEKSQFTVEEWEVEYLDENIGIWGKLEQVDNEWQLTATVDNDNLTGQDNEAVDISISAQNPSDFFALLPEFANTIANSIDADPKGLNETEPVYSADIIMPDGAVLKDFLDKLLEWDVNLLATLWGVEWDDDEISDDFSDLLTAGKTVNNEFSAWVLAKSITQTMRPGYSLIGDLLINQVTETVENLNSSLVAPILAGAIFNMGFAQQSYRLLANETKNRPDSAFAWFKLAEVYAEGGLLEQSIDTFQSAIENEAVNSALYRAYGNTLLLTSRSDHQTINSYILIDLNKYEENHPAWEAIFAYEEALKLDSSNVRARYAKVLLLAEVDFEQDYLWNDFTTLVKNDITGEYVSDVIDGFYDVNDIQQGVTVFEHEIQANPKRLDLYVNFSALYIAGYEAESAIPLLEKAKTLTQDTSELANIERLGLTANNPDFEYRFAEVVSILDAGNKLNANDVEFLENVVEQAPHVIDAHIALGRSYYYWEETNEALEVLLDAQESIPNQPSVIDWLGRILWESGERDTAFTYLNKGISAYPFNVQLLARAGQYLFDNEQLDEARVYLGRAEDISPRHPMLSEVRAYIARKMADNPAKYN